MRITIEKETRDLLREEAVELELAVKDHHHDNNRLVAEFERKVLSHSQHDWYCALAVEGEPSLFQSKNFPQQIDLRATSSQPRLEFEFQRTSEHILVQHAIVTDDGKQLLIVIGQPTEFIKADVWNLTKILLWIGLAQLIVAPIGGFFLARHATKPVREIIKTTRSLDPTHLDQRLTIRGTNDELDQISHEINQFVDQISKYLKSHRDFIANAAHELRSPLTAIQTSVEVTLSKDRNLAEYQEELETVSEQCQELRHLVNQLLELAETDAAIQKAILKPVDISRLADKSLNIFSGVAEEKGVKLNSTLPAETIINADETKLRQVINNLLDNALKFTPEGGQVDVCVEQTASEIKLSINDSGPGVPEPELKKIFDRFFQVDRARQRDSRRGNGLGLSICKSIVEMHGGTVEAQNRIPTGLQVTLTFPNKT